MDIGYPCPECGNQDTEWGTAEPNLRYAERQKGDPNGLHVNRFDRNQ